VTDPRDTRSPVAQAFAWASRVTSISLEMVLPGILGYWLDQRLGTRILFLVLGLILGFSAAMVHLIRLGNEPQNQEPLDGTGPDRSRPSR